MFPDGDCGKDGYLTGGLSYSIKELEKAGYIRRQCDTEDNRINHVVITDKGKEEINNSFVCFQEVEDALLGGFTEEETRQLEDFLRRIIRNGDEYYRNLIKQEKKK